MIYSDNLSCQDSAPQEEKEVKEQLAGGHQEGGEGVGEEVGGEGQEEEGQGGRQEGRAPLQRPRFDLRAARVAGTESYSVVSDRHETLVGLLEQGIL